MVAPSAFYLFGDETTHSLEVLRKLLMVGGNHLLTSFTDQAGLFIRQEIQNLPWSQKEKFPSFTTLLELLSNEALHPCHPALQLSISSVQNFAILLCELSSRPESSSQIDIKTFGFGIGSLAAVALSCFRSAELLIPVALEIVRISFRVGLSAASIRDEISPEGSFTRSWSVQIEEEIENDDLLEKLDEFSSKKHLPIWAKPYVSGISHNKALVTGIPTLLQEFISSHNLKAAELPVYAPYHGSHLYTEVDVDRILGPLSQNFWDTKSKWMLFTSPDGEPATPATLRLLLSAAVKSFLRELSSSDEILGAIKSAIVLNAVQPIKVVSIGTGRGFELTSMLQKHGCEAQCIDDFAISQTASVSSQPRQEKIAITGYSGRFPGAENLESFWDVLHRGVDTHTETPASRWDVKTHVDRNLKRKNTSATPYGCWLNNPGLFDRSFFSISPREAPQMDPAQRLALMCAYEAVEMAGLVPDATFSTIRSRIGVFIGCTSNDWCETNSPQDIDFYFIPGGNRAFIPGRINYFFKFCGPSFSIDTACSSSLAAIHLACNALWRKEIDTAIVGGTNVMTNPDVTAGLDRGHFLSRTGNCKTFDDGADGYCRGEGIGIVVLKRLEDAQAENDPIHACILSAGTNHSAEADSITRPHAGAQQALLSQVLCMAGVQPNDVSYVEMHGTGTQAGDGREMTSVIKTFAPWSPSDSRARKNDLYIGSVKANVGHGESVSGVTALIKTMLMMQKDEIPPHIGIKTKINESFPADLDERRIRIAKKPSPWIRTKQPRKAVINNFSAAGGNSCIVIEDAPVPTTGNRRPDTRSTHVVTVSAKSQTALEGNIRSLAQFIRTSESSVSLPDLAYTTTARRAHYMFRSSYTSQNTRELVQSLDNDIANPPKRARGPPKNIFAFSGQGSNQAGIGKSLYETNIKFRSDIDRFDAIVQEQGSNSIIPYLQGKVEQASPEIVQLAQVALQMALARLWESWGVKPAAVIGHSLGEYAALNYAGVLSDFDILWLCGQRAKLLNAHCAEGNYSMLAARTSRSTLIDIIADLDGVNVEISCVNSDSETVISGKNRDVDLFRQELESRDIRCSLINVPYAFHSSQLQPILDSFRRLTDRVRLRAAKIPIISTLLGTIINVDDEIDKEYLVRQCRETVDLVSAVRAAQAAAFLEDRSHIIEVGPSLVLSKLINRTVGSPLTINPSLEPNKDSWMVISRSVASAYRVGCNINWIQYHRDYSHSVIKLPSYAWDLKNYWLQYVHDWSLRKGDPLPQQQINASHGSRLQLKTTCCQEVVLAESEGSSIHLVVQSDLQSPNLKPVAGGHRVNGIAVCVGSVYAEMAMSVARSILNCFSSDTSNIAILINGLDMQESLTVSDTLEKQIVEIDAKCVWERKKADIEISSGTGNSKKLHCRVTVVYGDRKHEKQLLGQAVGPTKDLITSLKGGILSGLTERFTLSMAYRMVASLAHYDDSHKGVKECFLKSTTLEASSLVSLAPQNRLAGDFEFHPCIFDGILSLATFVLNANENSQFDQEVYVVRGWDSVFIDGALTADQEYETYVKMSARDKEVAVGDIAVMKGNDPIGYLTGVRVQRVPRRLMDIMFKRKGDARAVNTPPTNPVAKQEFNKESQKAAKPAHSTHKAENSAKIQKALGIIAEESGIELGELKDGELLANVGIDSLLILVIASRFREELQVDIQPTSFAEIDSIKGIKAFFNDSGDDEAPVPSPDPPRASREATSLIASHVNDRLDSVESSKIDTAIAIIAEESGMDVGELKNEDLLTDIGIDSLLCLAIASRFREELEFDLSPTFFSEANSVGEIKSSLRGQMNSPSSDDSGSTLSTQESSNSSDISTPASPPPNEIDQTIPKNNPVKSTSIILQGTLGPNTKTMFMFPDGSGSATSYMNIPRVHTDIAVIAMNCPYMTNPKDMEGSFIDITKILLTEVRRRQPKGPYYLGGWSAGGAFAYVATQLLLAEGEEVKSLVLIDAPCPIGLGKLPQVFFDYWRSIHQPGGIVQDRPLPPWLMDHFHAVNKNLRGFVAAPMPPRCSPKTYLVWAAKGTDNLAGFTGRHLLTPEENRDLGFLMDDKTDFSTRGWEKLIEGEIEISRAMTSNHFTIVRGDGAQIIKSLIKQACSFQD